MRGHQVRRATDVDPGLLSIGSGMIGRLRASGVSEELIACYPDVPEEALVPVAEAIHADRAQRWAVEQRGFWVHGVGSLAEYLRAIVPFDLEDRAAAIACPTAVTTAEDDPLARTSEQIYDALPGKEVLLRFQRSEGAGDHCEMRNRSLLDQRVFD